MTMPNVYTLSLQIMERKEQQWKQPNSLTMRNQNSVIVDGIHLLAP